MTPHQQRGRLRWAVLVALALAFALVGMGLGPGVVGEADAGSGTGVLHGPIAVVHPSGLTKVTTTVLSGHTAAHPLATTGPLLALALVALTLARRAIGGPIPVAAAARRLPPGRAPPGLSFTR